MAALIVFLVIIAFAGVASALGWTPDTTSRDWTAGRLLDSRRPAGSHRGG